MRAGSDDDAEMVTGRDATQRNATVPPKSFTGRCTGRGYLSTLEYLSSSRTHARLSTVSTAKSPMELCTGRMDALLHGEGRRNPTGTVAECIELHIAWEGCC